MSALELIIEKGWDNKTPTGKELKTAAAELAQLRSTAGAVRVGLLDIRLLSEWGKSHEEIGVAERFTRIDEAAERCVAALDGVK